MTKPRRRRWICERCDRPGVNAPGRMRRDDVRRYCLPCSEETGRLVERLCPALEAKRAASRERSAARAAGKRLAERARYTLDDGTDVRTLVRKARRLKAWAYEGEHVEMAVHRVRVDIAVGEPRGAHGRAWRRRVHVHLRRDTHPAVAMTIIVHELAHIAHNALGRDTRRSHGKVFWSLWEAAITEVYPALAGRGDEMRANRDRLVAENRELDAEAGLRWYSAYNHYALEWANRSLIERAHEGDL